MSQASTDRTEIRPFSLNSRTPRAVASRRVDPLRHALPAVGEHLQDGTIEEDPQSERLSRRQLEGRLLDAYVFPPVQRIGRERRAVLRPRLHDVRAQAGARRVHLQGPCLVVEQNQGLLFAVRSTTHHHAEPLPGRIVHVEGELQAVPVHPLQSHFRSLRQGQTLPPAVVPPEPLQFLGRFDEQAYRRGRGRAPGGGSSPPPSRRPVARSATGTRTPMPRRCACRPHRAGSPARTGVRPPQLIRAWRSGTKRSPS